MVAQKLDVAQYQLVGTTIIDVRAGRVFEAEVQDMTARRTVADRLAKALASVLGTPGLPVRLRAWDGSLAGPDGAPVIAVRSRRALRRLVWAPGQLGLGRAYVSGEIDIEGAAFTTCAPLRRAGRLTQGGAPLAELTPRDRLGLFGPALRLGALGREPAP